MRAPSHVALASLFVLCTGQVLVGCASQVEEVSPVPDLIASGKYVQAARAAAERYEADPNDPDRIHEYRTASVAVLMQEAREATFDDRDDEALELLARAAEIDPENEAVEAWTWKTNNKLAALWLDRAQGFAARQELASALDAFERAIGHQPENSAAQQGRARMLVLANYRAGVGEQYYKEGIRSLRKYYLHQARTNFEYTAGKYDPRHPDASRRGDYVAELLAAEKVETAREFEAGGHYYAAGNEYRLALLFDPENADAEEGRVRMEREAGAREKLSHAEWLRMRGRFDEARVALDEGLGMTDVQGTAFESASIDIDEKEYEILYEEALRLERDFQYEEAIVVFDELLEQAGYYEDAITRRSTLDGFVRQAKDLYEQAGNADSAEDELIFLRQVEIIWPEYRDVEERLRALEAATAEE